MIYKTSTELIKYILILLSRTTRWNIYRMPTVFCLPEAIIQKQCQEGIIVSIEATVITEHKSDIDSMYNKHKELWTIVTHSKLYLLKIMSGQVQLYDDGYDSASLAAVGSYGYFTIAFIKHILWTGGATLNICANYLCRYGIIDCPRRRSPFYIIVTPITLFPTVVMIKKFGYITHKPRDKCRQLCVFASIWPLMCGDRVISV